MPVTNEVQPLLTRLLQDVLNVLLKVHRQIIQAKVPVRAPIFVVIFMASRVLVAAGIPQPYVVPGLCQFEC